MARATATSVDSREPREEGAERHGDLRIEKAAFIYRISKIKKPQPGRKCTTIFNRLSLQACAQAAQKRHCQVLANKAKQFGPSGTGVASLQFAALARVPIKQQEQKLTVKPVETYARIGCFSYTYAEAAEKGYSDYLKYSSEIKKFGEVEYDEKLEELRHLKEVSGLQTIVFSAMCFEAAIYNFSSIHLGDDYVRENLDKLDLLSKWVVVLRFVSGIELRKDESAYGLLKTLIQARNKLVHAKSENFEFEITARLRQSERLKKLEAEYESSVHIAFRALVTMSLYFDASSVGHHNPLPAYDAVNAPMRRYYLELKSVIDQCRENLAKNRSS